MDPNDDMQTLWAAFLVTGDDTLFSALDDHRVALELDHDSPAWTAITAALPGYDKWWSRMRREYLAALAATLSKEEPAMTWREELDDLLQVPDAVHLEPEPVNILRHGEAQIL